MLAIPAMAVEEHEVVGETAPDALDYAIEQTDGRARAALPDGIQLAHFYAPRAHVCRRRRLTTGVTNDSPHACSLDS